MLPKSKSNHNESTSLSNLNNVNNMMINYNSTNLMSSQSKLSTSSDERYDCRALICDSNGIIIGETAYRCMICAQINDSIAETKQHYYENHSNEFLLGQSATNLSNSLNQNIATTNGNFITNSILNSSLNNSLNNGALQLSAAAAAAIQQNSNSLLSNNNETLSAKKRKNVSDVLEKIYGSKNVTSSSSNKNRNSANLIQQSTGSLSNYLNNSQLNNQLNSQLINQLSNQTANNHFNSNQLNNQLNNLNNQLNNDEYDEDDLDDQKSDLDNDDWLMRTNTINNLSNDFLNATTTNSSNTILDVINKTSLFMKLSENINNNINNNESLSKDLKNKKLNNLFVDNSFETDYSNPNSLENMIGNDSENKDDSSKGIPPCVKLKRGSTTANVGKPGHVSCAVCGVVRFYSCVYRRYGQFTCQVCYRFFRTFFAKPHRYTCTNLGSCPLDVRVRCRACWIQACINLYSVDGQRKQILDTYRPLNKSADESTDNNNNSTNVNDKNSKLSNKHNLDDLENSSRNSKKIKKAANNSFNDQQVKQEYSNGDELEEEIVDEDVCIQEDEDQDEPLNMITKKIDLSDEDSKNELSDVD